MAAPALRNVQVPGLIVAGAVLLAIASPATAGAVLWGKVEVGMTADQVRALYPAQEGTVKHGRDDVTIKGAVQIGRCHPSVHINLTGGVVREITTGMHDRGILPACVEDAYRAMIERYGKPDIENVEKTAPFGIDHNKTISRWIKDGVVIEMIKDEGANEGWSVSYRAVNGEKTGL
ncbi:MAG TPA: hypothetical protein VH331_09265 [Allosphingosinicella sp.]|jgi:hypothetical protein|nr:hypothetical protein [Allosphingosinicella sp.]